MHTSEQPFTVQEELRSKPVLRFLAALLSIIIPGSGQWLLGDRKQAIRLFLAFLFLCLLYWPIRLPIYYGGLIFALFYAVALAIISSYFALTAFSEKLLPLSAWWMLAVAPFACFFAIAVNMSIFLHAAGFRVFTIPSTSMAPTLTEGDTIVADMRRFSHQSPIDGDIVIFKHKGLYLVKRVAASGGEQISSASGYITVNGVQRNEPYAHHEGNASTEMNDFSTKIVPAKELFVMGDNRDLSLDSRMEEFGNVISNDVAGIPLYIISAKSDRSGRKIQ